MKKTKVALYTVFITFVVLSVILIIILALVWFNIKKVEQTNESINTYESISQETTAAVGETVAIEIPETSSVSVEGDYVDSDVNNVKNTLIASLLESEYYSDVVGEENIIAEPTEDGGYKISLTNLKRLGYPQEDMLIYVIDSVGTYSVSAEKADLERYIENVVYSHEQAEFDVGLLSKVNGLDKIDGAVEAVKEEVTLYLSDTSEIYSSYEVEVIDGTEFEIVGLEQNGDKKYLLHCSIAYEDGFGNYLDIYRIEQ